MANDATTITFEDKRVKDFFGSIKNRLGEIESRHTKVINEIFSAVIFRDIIRHFENEQGPGKRKWKSWSKSYSDFMNKIGKGGNKILQDSGRLRQGFQPGNWRTEPNTLIWYNNAKTAKGFPYAAAHDEGGGKLPQRKFMYLSDRAKDDIMENILNHLVKK